MEMPPDQYALYAEFGIAAETAQALEISAGNVALAFLTVFFRPDQIGPEEREMFRGLVDDLNEKTLGRLLKYVQSTGTFDPLMLQTMDEALQKRNYLTHHFFRTQNFAIFDAVGRQAMTEELKSIQLTLEKGRTMLEGIAGLLLQLAGREDLSDEVAAELRAKGKRVNI